MDINIFLTYSMWKFMLVLFIIAALLTSLIICLLWPKMKIKFEEEKKKEEDNSKKQSILSKLIDLVIICIIAPYLETLIFQFAIFKVVKFFFRAKYIYFTLFVIISTILFAWAHGLLNKDWKSTIIHLPLSMALSLVFLVSVINNLKPLQNTSIFHAIWNTVAGVLIPVSANITTYFKKIALRKK